MHQEQHDEQPAESAVAVEERVDRLELVLDQRSLHQRWQLGLLVHEALEVAEQVAQLVRWRRHERRRLDRGAGCPDPVLGGSHLSGLTFTTPDPCQDRGVQLSEQAGADGQVGQPPKALLHRCDVVDDLFDVGSERPAVGFGLVDLHERGLGAIDARRRQRLSSEVRLHQQVRLRQQPTGPGESSERCLGIGQA